MKTPDKIIREERKLLESLRSRLCTCDMRDFDSVKSAFDAQKQKLDELCFALTGETAR